MVYKALILVGGYGTRLRPLTLTRPKPLVEFCNKPILFHQMEALIDCGVDTIVLAVSYMCEMMEDQIKKFAKTRNVEVVFSREDEPLGTAGPLALARDYLSGHENFIVLNSDVICLYPFKDMLEYHLSKQAEGTIAVTKVDEPSKYGVVVSEPNGMVVKFVEKPSTYVSNKINAGIYILNTTVLDRIKPVLTSIEKEIFPAMASDKILYSYSLEGYWMDIGQPKDYLIGTNLYLAHLEICHPEKLGSSMHSTKNGLIHPTAMIGNNCFIGRGVVIGENVTIGHGVCLRSCVILPGTVIKSFSYIENSIIGWRCIIGRWVRIQGYSILGEDVNVKDETFINAAKILPHKCITESYYTPEIIM